MLRSDAPELYDGLTSGGGLVMVLLSGAAGVATLTLVYREHFGLARVTAAGAVAAIVVGWVLAQKPYLLPPKLTLEQAAADDAVLSAVVIAVSVGMVILVPSLWWLYRLVLQGRLDQELPAHRPAVPYMKVALMFGSLAVGLVLMIGFEAMLTRIVGVLALFTFIITGVFLIADPAFLEREED